MCEVKYDERERGRERRRFNSTAVRNANISDYRMLSAWQCPLGKLACKLIWYFGFGYDLEQPANGLIDNFKEL